MGDDLLTGRKKRTEIIASEQVPCSGFSREHRRALHHARSAHIMAPFPGDQSIAT